MNLTSATALLPTLENLFGQVYGWTLPETAISIKNLRQSDILSNLIRIGAGKCTAEQFSFVWFHEAYHFVQFELDGRDLDAYMAAAAPLLTARDNASYVWVREEREANVAAFEMCNRLGLTDFIPDWIPAGYFE